MVCKILTMLVLLVLMSSCAVGTNKQNAHQDSVDKEQGYLFYLKSDQNYINCRYDELNLSEELTQKITDVFLSDKDEDFAPFAKNCFKFVCKKANDVQKCKGFGVIELAK